MDTEPITTPTRPIPDAAAAVADAADLAFLMLREIRSTAWWQILTHTEPLAQKDPDIDPTPPRSL